MKSILKTVRNDVLLIAFSIVLILSFRDLEKTKSYAAGAGGYPTPTPIAYFVPSAYGTIQAAINAASDGGEIIVSPGTYQENINFAGKNIIVRSTDPDNSAIVETTIIDGNNSGAVVSFGGDEDFTATVKGFKIINGQNENGAAFAGDYSLASIENNIIMTNLANDGGGETSYGAILYRCSGIIENNIIRTDGTTCLGGDDRVGIYIIEYLLKQNPDIGVLFTDFEESGGIGAKSFCREYDGDFEYEALIQVDRAGINHYVNYHPISKQLEIYLNNIGLKREHGSFSDISILSPYFNIDAINIACGYYKEHTCNEFININDMDICISLCQIITHYNRGIECTNKLVN